MNFKVKDKIYSKLISYYVEIHSVILNTTIEKEHYWIVY